MINPLLRNTIKGAIWYQGKHLNKKKISTEPFNHIHVYIKFKERYYI